MVAVAARFAVVSLSHLRVSAVGQALQTMLADPADTTEVTLLYGNKSEPDILLRSELDKLAAQHPEQLRLTHVVGGAPDDPPPPGWDGETGWIDAEKIERLCPPPADDALVFVCGLPSMYESLCGPREEAALAEGSVLPGLGYTEQMVYKF